MLQHLLLQLQILTRFFATASQDCEFYHMVSCTPPWPSHAQPDSVKQLVRALNDKATLHAKTDEVGAMCNGEQGLHADSQKAACCHRAQTWQTLCCPAHGSTLTHAPCTPIKVCAFYT